MIALDTQGFLLLTVVLGLLGFSVGWVAGKAQGRDEEREKWYGRIAKREAPFNGD